MRICVMTGFGPVIMSCRRTRLGLRLDARAERAHDDDDRTLARMLRMKKNQGWRDAQ